MSTDVLKALLTTISVSIRSKSRIDAAGAVCQFNEKEVMAPKIIRRMVASLAIVRYVPD